MLSITLTGKSCNLTSFHFGRYACTISCIRTATIRGAGGYPGCIQNAVTGPWTRRTELTWASLTGFDLPAIQCSCAAPSPIGRRCRASCSVRGEFGQPSEGLLVPRLSGVISQRGAEC